MICISCFTFLESVLESQYNTPARDTHVYQLLALGCKCVDVGVCLGSSYCRKGGMCPRADGRVQSGQQLTQFLGRERYSGKRTNLGSQTSQVAKLAAPLTLI